MKKLALALLAVLIVAFFVPLASAATDAVQRPNRLSLSHSGVGIATWAINVKQGTGMVTIPITVIFGLDLTNGWNQWVYVSVDHPNGAGKAWAMGEMNFNSWGSRALISAILNFNYGTGQSALHTIEVTWEIGTSWGLLNPGYQCIGTRSGISVSVYNGLVRVSYPSITIDHGPAGGYLADEAYYVIGDFFEISLP